MGIDIGTQEPNSRFAEIDKKFLQESRKRLELESDKSDKKLEQLEKDKFLLNKDLLLLSGTIFGSSIALATGRIVNYRFVFGEMFLFLSIISGLIIQSVYLKGREWDHAFFSKMSFESFLLSNKDKIEIWELNSINGLIESYKKIMEANQNGLIFFLLKRISIEKWQPIFITNLVLGILLVLLSTIPISFSNIKYSAETNTNTTEYITPIPADIFYVPSK